MLALHPDVQDTLVSEIHQTIGDRDPTYEDFHNLVYPLCVLFETLRHFPPVVQVPKATLNGDQILLGKHFLPKDTTVMYDVVNVQRNKKYWGDDVDKFNPSRFDGRKNPEKIQLADTGDTAPGATYDKIKLPQKGAFVPFSEGSRSCLGNVPCASCTRFNFVGRKFAQVEIVGCVTTVIRKWRVELKEDWTHERVWSVLDRSTSLLTLFPPDDIPLVFRRRSQVG